MKIVRAFLSVRGLNTDKIKFPFAYGQLHLIRNQKFIVDNFLDTFVVHELGRLNMQDLIDSPVFYVLVNCPDEIAETPMLVSQKSFDRVNFLMNCCWFIKDNSISIKHGFAYVKETRNTNSFNNIDVFNNCMGEYADVSFSNLELKKAIKIADKITNIQSRAFDKKQYDSSIIDNSKNHAGVYGGITNQIEYNTNNRIDRAYQFLKIARQTEFIVMKMAFYMNIFECLFATEGIEIKYKLSSRVACYTTTKKADRLEIFNLIKDCYDVRSAYYHGDQLNTKFNLEWMRERMMKLDELTRKVLNKVIMVDSELFLGKGFQNWMQSISPFK